MPVLSTRPAGCGLTSPSQRRRRRTRYARRLLSRLCLLQVHKPRPVRRLGAGRSQPVQLTAGDIARLAADVARPRQRRHRVMQSPRPPCSSATAPPDRLTELTASILRLSRARQRRFCYRGRPKGSTSAYFVHMRHKIVIYVKQLGILLNL